MKKICAILLAVPFAVVGERVATDAMAGQYSPPILANGDIGMLIDYRNCQFQDVPSYRTIHAVGEKYLPGIYRAARRTENGKLAAFGRIEEHVTLAGDADAKPVNWRQTLDITNALSVCENVYAGGVRIDSTAFVAQHTAVIAVEKRFSGDVERYAFDYVFRRTGTDARLPLNTTATFKPGEVTFSIDREKHSIDGTVTVFSDAPGARAETIDKGLRLTLDRPRGTVRFFLVFRDSLDARKPDLASVRAAGWDGLLRAHTDAWRAFWGDTYISIPDARIQEIYYTALYNLKCWSTQWSIPVGILPTHWHGAFFGFTFFGPALCASGHVPEAVKVAKFWGSEAHRRSAQARAGNVKRSPDCGLRYNWETLEDFSEFSKKGRWLDHYLHLGNISLECWTAWRYTGDRDLLRNTVYPVVKGCAQYFQTHHVWETKDGRTILGPLCDLERLPCPVRNAYLTTCGAIFCFEKAAEGAKLLGVDGAAAEEWRRLAAALRRDLPSDGTRYLPFEGYAERSVGVLSGILPYGTVPADDPRQLAAIADFEQNGLSVGNMYSVGTRICTWYAAWLAGAQARLGDGEGAYRNLKRAAASAGAFAEIFEINEPAYRSCPWCSSPQGTFVQAVNEMLLQGEGDDIKLAPAVPASWRDFAFRLRAPGGKTVEAVFRDGACVKRTVGNWDKTVRKTP